MSAPVLTVDLGALIANWRLLRDRAAPAECAAAVKANAYGIGIGPAVAALAGAGCRTFFVAHLAEGALARRVAPDATIYVLNGLLPGNAGAYPPAGLRPVLGSGAEIAEWAGFCREAGQRFPAAIHVDTGMNRLGLPPDEAAALARDPVLGAFEPTLLMSHFAAAENPADPANARQVAEFEAIIPLFPAVPASLANSSGVFLPARPFHALVRPGFALYGGNPTPGRPNPMRPVVRFEAAIVQVRTVAAGTSVGYNGRWTAPGPRTLATISAGYADGVARAGSGWDDAASSGVALVGGVVCPFAGTVSMDTVILDITDAPAAAARRGGVATLIGDELDVDAVARRAGTNGYEILTRLGRRSDKRYTGADGSNAP